MHGKNRPSKGMRKHSRRQKAEERKKIVRKAPQLDDFQRARIFIRGKGCPYCGKPFMEKEEACRKAQAEDGEFTIIKCSKCKKQYRW